MHVAETASTARADRAALIARAREAYAKHGEALARLTDEASFVSCSLQDLGEERLTEEEVASLRVANDRRRRAERDTVIAKARREYIEHPALCRLTSEEAFVSCRLSDAGFSRLSAVEVVGLGVCGADRWSREAKR